MKKYCFIIVVLITIFLCTEGMTQSSDPNSEGGLLNSGGLVINDNLKPLPYKVPLLPEIDVSGLSKYGKGSGERMSAKQLEYTTENEKRLIGKGISEKRRYGDKQRSKRRCKRKDYDPSTYKQGLNIKSTSNTNKDIFNSPYRRASEPTKYKEFHPNKRDYYHLENVMERKTCN